MRLFATILSPFPNHQIITLEDDSNADDILTQLNETCNLQIIFHNYFVTVSNTTLNVSSEVLPYLNKVVLTEQVNFQTTTSHHFNLKQQPRASSQLRADVLHRGIFIIMYNI